MAILDGVIANQQCSEMHDQ